MRLAKKLEEGLTRLNRQKELLEDLLKTAPDEQPFGQGDAIKLRVGEYLFHTSLSTMRRESDSMLAAMFSGKFKLTTDADGAYFVDRDGSMFGHILSWLRTGRAPPATLSETERENLLHECVYFGLVRLEEIVKLQIAKDVREDELSMGTEKSTMTNIQSIATSNYVQSVIASLAEVTHLAFRQMASDAEMGHAETTLTFVPGQNFHEFFVTPEGTHRQTLQIFLELLRQEGAPCKLVAHPSNIIIRCPLLRPDREICQEVLRNFKKMRGFARGERGAGGTGHTL